MQTKINSHKIGSAVLSGLLLTGSFPKIGISWSAWFALLPLLLAVRDLSPQSAFRVGFLTGLVHYLSLLYWLVYTMKTYGYLPVMVGFCILFLFAAFLALYVAVFSMMLTWSCEKPVLCLFMIPVLWVLLEYVRSFLLTGFPWALIGYSQFKILPIIQISDILGVYGISFLVAMVNATIFLGTLFLTGKKWKQLSVSGNILPVVIGVTVMVLGAAWYYGKWRIRAVDDLISQTPRKRIAVVQGNIEQEKKWDPAFQEETVRKYIDLSIPSKAPQADLVVWPETATPFYFFHDIRLSEMVQNGIRHIGSNFIIGSPSFIRSIDGEAYYNSAYLIGPDGKLLGKYDKSHLVPFGEYVPLKRWLPFLGKMVEQVGDFRPGKEGETLAWGTTRIGVQICYEIIFPNLSRKMVKNGAAFLVNITNDAWFGPTDAPFQHFSMAVFRAVENRRALVRSANTGISGFIDPVGRIIEKTPLFRDATLTQDIPILDRNTFYSRFGDLFALWCGVTTLLLIGIGKLWKISK